MIRSASIGSGASSRLASTSTAPTGSACFASVERGSKRPWARRFQGRGERSRRQAVDARWPCSSPRTRRCSPRWPRSRASARRVLRRAARHRQEPADPRARPPGPRAGAPDPSAAVGRGPARFEASEASRRYPLNDGVTHGVIRLAVGRWARAAVARWHAGIPAPRPADRRDAFHRPSPHRARPARARRRRAPAGDSATRFVIPVPSRELRAHLEAERERRARQPQHPREREDARPRSACALGDLLGAAVALGCSTPWRERAPYDPAIYRRVYERLLRSGVTSRRSACTPSCRRRRLRLRFPVPPWIWSRASEAGRLRARGRGALRRSSTSRARHHAWYVDTPFDAPLDSRHSPSTPS